MSLKLAEKYVDLKERGWHISQDSNFVANFYWTIKYAN